MLKSGIRIERDTAIRAFGGETAQYCDGQFVAAGAHLLCFFDPDVATLDSPDQLKWRPRTLYQLRSPSAFRPYWLPEAEDGVYTVFLRTPSEVNYIHLGAARQSACALSPDAAQAWALFQLDQKAPRESWLALGGHPGWLAEGDFPAQLDHLMADEYCAQLTAGMKAGGSKFRNVVLSRYEGDRLRLSTNGRRAVLEYSAPGDAGWRRFTGELDRSESPEVFQFTVGAGPYCVAAEETLRIPRAIDAIQFCLAEGQLPDWLRQEVAHPGDDESRIRDETIVQLRYMFGYSLAEADALLARYVRRMTGLGEASPDQQIEAGEAPRDIAFQAQWMIALEQPADFSARFCKWRNHEEARLVLRLRSG